MNKKNKKKQKGTPFGDYDEDSYLREAIEESLITAKIEEEKRAAESKVERT